MARQKTPAEKRKELEAQAEKIEQEKNRIKREKQKLAQEEKAEKKRQEDRAKIIIGACLAKNIGANQLEAMQTLFMTHLDTRDAEAVRAVYPHLVPATPDQADAYKKELQDREDQKKHDGMNKEEIEREMGKLDD